MGLRTDVGLTHQVRDQGALAHCFLLLGLTESLLFVLVSLLHTHTHTHTHTCTRTHTHTHTPPHPLVQPNPDGQHSAMMRTLDARAAETQALVPIPLQPWAHILSPLNFTFLRRLRD